MKHQMTLETFEFFFYRRVEIYRIFSDARSERWENSTPQFVFQTPPLIYIEWQISSSVKAKKKKKNSREKRGTKYYVSSICIFTPLWMQFYTLPNECIAAQTFFGITFSIEQALPWIRC